MNIKKLLLVLLTMCLFGDICAQNASVTIESNNNVVCYGNMVTLQASNIPDSAICQWQQSLNAIDYTDIPGSVNQNPFEISIYQISYFRLKIIYGNDTSYSINTLTISNYPQLIPASIIGDDTICNSSLPEPITILTIPSGSNNTHNQWQQKTGSSSWTNVGSVDQQSFQPTSLTQTTYYRLKTYSSYCDETVYSNEVSITVLPEMILTIDSNRSVCYNDNVSITVHAIGAGNTYTYQWQESIDGTSYNDMISTDSTLNVQNLLADHYYRCIVISTAGCGSITSNATHIHVYPDLSSPIITGGDTICYDSQLSSPMRVQSYATDASLTYNYQWELFNSNTGSWTNIPGATQDTYLPGNLIYSSKYRLKVSCQCGTVYSNEQVVTVRPPIIAPQILYSGDTICYGDTPNAIQMFIPATDNFGGTFNYQWQHTTDGLIFSSISGASGSSYQPGALMASQSYRIVAFSQQGCPMVASNSITINVLSALNGSITNNQSICHNSSATVQASAFGAGSTYTYQWQESTDNVSFTSLSGETNQTLFVPSLAYDHYYKCVILSNRCGVSTTTAACQIHVYPDFQAPVIGNSGDDTICYQTAPAILTITTPPSGSNSTYSYQWEKQNSDGTWNAILGATQSAYQSGSLSSSTSFRLKVSSLCGVVYSNVVTIIVRPNVTNPQISYSGGTICYGTIPDTLFISTFATDNFGGSFSYQWQQSQNSSYTDIPSATGMTLQPNTLFSSINYRIKATSLQGCGVFYSNIEHVEVWNDLSISIQGDAAICYNTSNGLSCIAAGAGNSFSYQWYESADGLNFIPASNGISQTFVTNNLTSDSYYRCEVTPTSGCAMKSSNIFHVTVFPDLQPATISNMGLDTVCYNSSPGQISVSSYPSGANGSYTWQWEHIDENGNWIPINGATQIYYIPVSLLKTEVYRLKTTSTLCGNHVYSNSVTIHVRQPLSPATILYPGDTICYNHQPDSILISTFASDGLNGNFSYQWYENNIPIPNAVDSFYRPTFLTQTSIYHVAATSLNGCGIVNSSPVTINVWNDLQLVVSNDTSICFNSNCFLYVQSAGAGNQYSYQWQQSSDDVSYSDISGAFSRQLSLSDLVSDQYYRCVVTPVNHCPTKTSLASLVHVYPQLVSATITGSDTICYNTVPVPLSVSSFPIGSNGIYEYQWQKKLTNSGWENINGATSITYQPPILDTTSVFRLRTTSLCGEVFSDSLIINVRRPLSPANIFYVGDTICYGTSPGTLTINTTPSDGLGGGFSYQWLESFDGSTFWTIQNETHNSYTPDTLNSFRFYQLQNVSDHGCGSILSNILKINVWDDLNINVYNDTTICYATEASFNVIATGSGNEYTYQWIDSISTAGSGTDVSGATYQSFHTGNITETHYYKCLVSPIRGCSSKYSDYVQAIVMPELTAGTIIAPSEVCFGEEYTCTMQTPTTGGDGLFSYLWQKSHDGINWNDLQTETTSVYHQIADSSFFIRLKQINFCGEVSSNILYVLVNPLPQPQPIQGDENVCANQFEWYQIEQLNEGFSYHWSVENNGEIVSDDDDTRLIEVHWFETNSPSTITLDVTNDLTGCISTNIFSVITSNESSPDKTIIVRKPNSNILVAQTDIDGYYEWGYTDKQSGESSMIENSNRRYVLLPMPFDATAYDYWLRLKHTKNSSCYSLSYYSPDNDTLITPEVSYPVKISQTSSSQLSIRVNNANGADVHIQVYSILGQLLYYDHCGHSYTISENVALKPGAYIVSVKIGNELFNQKTVVK